MTKRRFSSEVDTKKPAEGCAGAFLYTSKGALIMRVDVELKLTDFGGSNIGPNAAATTDDKRSFPIVNCLPRSSSVLAERFADLISLWGIGVDRGLGCGLGVELRISVRTIWVR